jgi:hypothetical protein
MSAGLPVAARLIAVFAAKKVDNAWNYPDAS